MRQPLRQRCVLGQRFSCSGAMPGVMQRGEPIKVLVILMKKSLRFLVIFLISGMLLVLGGMLALTLYYRSNFPVNTWINGVYCTGKSIEEVNEELLNAQEASVVTILDDDGADWEIDMEEADISPDYMDALKAYLKKNATGHWLDNLQEPKASELAVEKYTLDEGKLRDCLESLPFIVDEHSRKEGVRVCKSEEGFFLEDGNEHRLNLEKAFAYLKDCLSKGQTVIDLAEGGCYEDLTDSASDELQRDIWTQVCAFTEVGSRIIYDMGAEQISLTPDIMAGFLKVRQNGCPALDKEGHIIINEAKVEEWVEDLASAYDTCGTEKEFPSTRGDLVTVKYVTYGTKLDTESEKAYLLEALQSDSVTVDTHVPLYLQQGYVRGLDDIGGTYIEVDMTEQKMYYYADGELTLETDIVTGNTGRRMGTPQGINFVYAKQRNRTLRGADYASFVKYWMPVKGNIGIHDASWRGKFGGEIYKSNGSHGCINTPTSVMSQLYEMAEIGTPVIMFY